MRTLQEIADALAPAVRAIAPGRTLTNAEVQIINALAELLHRREANDNAPAPPTGTCPIAWGAKVSPTFRDRVRWIAGDLGVGPDELMACMAWESGRSFSPSMKNMAGSGAVGLIQFMPATALGLGTTTARLAAMTAEDQLNYVYKYFEPSKGKLHNLGDLYMAILWPAGVGKPDSYVLWDRASRPTTYRQNMGLDVDKDGAITRGECLVKLNAMLVEGRRPENLA